MTFITQKQFETWLDGFGSRAHPCDGGGCPITEASRGAIAWVNESGWGIDASERAGKTPAWAVRFIRAIDHSGKPWRTLTAAHIRRIYEESKR